MLVSNNYPRYYLYYLINQLNYIFVLGYIMASKLYNIIVGGASVSAGAYLTTWLLTGENPTVCITFVLLLFNYYCSCCLSKFIIYIDRYLLYYLYFLDMYLLHKNIRCLYSLLPQARE